MDELTRLWVSTLGVAFGAGLVAWGVTRITLARWKSAQPDPLPCKSQLVDAENVLTLQADKPEDLLAMLTMHEAWRATRPGESFGVTGSFFVVKPGAK
jgi:hypothetical protein